MKQYYLSNPGAYESVRMVYVADGAGEWVKYEDALDALESARGALRLADKVFSVAFDGAPGSLTPCHDEVVAMRAVRAELDKEQG